VHRLSGRSGDDNAKSYLSRVTVQGGGEVIWVGFKQIESIGQVSHYRYSQEDVEGDRFARRQLLMISDYRLYCHCRRFEFRLERRLRTACLARDLEPGIR
jgi:hypothetical protein